jgi:serine phosphatase RsbU (regulator of sigma subunit)
MNMSFISFVISSCFSLFLLIQSVIFLISFSGYKKVILYSSASLYYIGLIALFNSITSIIGMFIYSEKTPVLFHILKNTTANLSLIFLIFLIRNLLVSLKDMTFVETDDYKEKTKLYLIVFTAINLIFIFSNFIYFIFLSSQLFIYKIISLAFMFFLFTISIFEIIEFKTAITREKGKISEINLLRYKVIFFSSISAILLSTLDIAVTIMDKINYFIKFGSMYAYGVIFLSLSLSLNFIFEYLDVLVRASEMNKKLTELNRQIIDDIRTAQSLQISLLPLDKQKMIQKYIDMEISYMPMQSVGGDYYDFYTLDHSKLLTFLGDASGHGIYAAMIWAILKVEIEELIEEGKFADLGEAFYILNQRLTRILENTYSYATLFASLIDINEKKLSFISAGHIDQLYYNSSEEKLKWLKNKNPIMGTFKNARFSVNNIQLNKEDVLILFSDGIIEGTNPAGEQLGKTNLVEILKKVNMKRTASEILSEILIYLEEFFEGTLQQDDRTLLVIKI